MVWQEKMIRYVLKMWAGCKFFLIRCLGVEKHWIYIEQLNKAFCDVSHHERCVIASIIFHLDITKLFEPFGCSFSSCLCFVCVLERKMGEQGKMRVKKKYTFAACDHGWQVHYNWEETGYQPCLSSSVILCATTLDKQSIHILLSFSVFAFKTKSLSGVAKVKQ